MEGRDKGSMFFNPLVPLGTDGGMSRPPSFEWERGLTESSSDSEGRESRWLSDDAFSGWSRSLLCPQYSGCWLEGHH